MRRRTSPFSSGLWVIAAAILLQAVLAGLFISGVANLRNIHMWIGWILPFAAIVPAIQAYVTDAGRAAAGWVQVGAVLLPVGLWIQEMLGHVPAAATTAIHVPLGVTLFGASVVLAVIAGAAPEESQTTVADDRSRG